MNKALISDKCSKTHAILMLPRYADGHPTLFEACTCWKSYQCRHAFYGAIT